MRLCSKTLVAVVVVALIVSSSQAMDREPTPDEILKSIDELSSPDPDVVQNARNRLVGVRSNEGITAILDSVQNAIAMSRQFCGFVLSRPHAPRGRMRPRWATPRIVDGRRPSLAMRPRQATGFKCRKRTDCGPLESGRRGFD